jgi:ABC-type bacteriocin/lantibiotic exporter with double-glycine peptidase domain
MRRRQQVWVSWSVLRLFAPLLTARVLATQTLVRRGAVLGTLSFAERVLTPMTAWVLFARPVQVKVAVAVALGAVFTLRALLQRALTSRTEADLMGRVIACVLDGNVLRASVLPEEDAQADLGHGIYFGAQQLTEVLPALFADLAAAVVFAVVLSCVEPARLVLGAGAVTAAAGIALMWSRGRVQRLVRATWELRDRVVDRLVDALEGRLEIVAAGQRSAFDADAQERARAWGASGVRAAGASVMSGRIPLVLIGSAVAVTVTVDSRWRASFPVTLAEVALFASVTPAFTGIAQGLLALLQMEHSVHAVARVIEDARPRRGGETPPTLPASIAFDRVSFRYDDADADALANVTLAWQDERVIALSGANGSGKSTCLRLLLALARPQGGSVRVGGLDLGDLDPEAWRARIAFLPQRPYLPQRSDVRSAIHLLAPRASETRILAALDRVGILPALRRAGPDPLAVGVDSLSVGQRQRIALARMLCRDAVLFLLDEPDANLDRAGIALVVDIVRELSRQRTVMLAAHTPELLALADRVVTLDGGRVVRDEAARADGEEARRSWP